MIFPVSLPIKISTGLLAEYIVRVSSKSLTDLKLFSIINWIFHSALLLLVLLLVLVLLLLVLVLVLVLLFYLIPLLVYDHLLNFLNMV